MRRRGFTWLQAFVALAVMLILAAIILPIFARFNENNKPHSCISNLKQIYLAFQIYMQDYDERYPLAINSGAGLEASDNWCGLLQPYLKYSLVFQCPSEKDSVTNQSTYGYNARLHRINDSQLPQSYQEWIVLNFEVRPDEAGNTQTGRFPSAITAPTRHMDGANYSFVDGHVEWYRPEQITMQSPQKKRPTFRTSRPPQKRQQ